MAVPLRAVPDGAPVGLRDVIADARRRWLDPEDILLLLEHAGQPGVPISTAAPVVEQSWVLGTRACCRRRACARCRRRAAATALQRALTAWPATPAGQRQGLLFVFDTQRTPKYRRDGGERALIWKRESHMFLSSSGIEDRLLAIAIAHGVDTSTHDVRIETNYAHHKDAVKGEVSARRLCSRSGTAARAAALTHLPPGLLAAAPAAPAPRAL